MANQPRLTFETCDEIDAIEEAFDAATADGVVDLAERRQVKARIARAQTTAALADEGLAIMVAGVRRGPESPRFRRLLRERDQRHEDPRPAA